MEPISFSPVMHTATVKLRENSLTQKTSLGQSSTAVPLPRCRATSMTPLSAKDSSEPTKQALQPMPPVGDLRRVQSPLPITKELFADRRPYPTTTNISPSLVDRRPSKHQGESAAATDAKKEKGNSPLTRRSGKKPNPLVAL